jgi:PKD repeat protein
VNGTRWTATAGTILCGGTYTPISLNIPTGVTVSALNGTTVVIQASNWIEVTGTLSADGAGGAGGPACPGSDGTAGTAGSGSGGGGAGTSTDSTQGGTGGGGGGFGCASGTCGGGGGGGSVFSGPMANPMNGGVAYDTGNTFSLSQPAGSGGGSGSCSGNGDASGAGGNGGGSIALIAPEIQIDSGGVVSANGLDGTAGPGGGGGGGGGSGGDILLEGPAILTNNGTVSVIGGAGNGTSSTFWLGGGGGGGSGGRVKIAALSSCSLGGTVNLGGGKGGPGYTNALGYTANPGSAGQSGTMSCETLEATLAPTASPGTASVGQTTTISANATNPGSYPLMYQYDCTGTGASYSSATSSATTTCSWNTLGAHIVDVKETAYNTTPLINGTAPGGLLLFSLTATTTVNVDLSASLSAPMTGRIGTAVTPIMGSVISSSGLSPYTWKWDYGDGSALTVATGATTNTQSHAYEAPGTFTITLRAVDSAGTTASATAVVSIAEVDPVVTIGRLPSPINAGTGAMFSATASSVSTSASTTGFTYTFDWGDLTTPTSVPPTTGNGAGVTAPHTYATPGTYLLKASVEDPFGGVDSQSEMVTVIDPIPAVQLGVVATPVALGSPLMAVASATGADATSFTYVFNWGDGQSTTLAGGNSETPAHTYEVPGNYTIQLTVTDQTGAQATASLLIVITEVVPTVNLGTPSPSPVVARTMSTFSALASSVSSVATSAGFSYAFDWGDGSPASTVSGTAPGSSAMASHAYAEPGPYLLTISAQDRFGGTGTASTTLIVSDASPTAAFGAATYSGVAASPVSITATASSPVASQQAGSFTYVFTWGDGQSSTVTAGTSVSTTHSYDSGGNYTATLSVMDSLSTLSPTAMATMTITNVAPTISGFVHPSAGILAAPTAFSVQVSDVSETDTKAGFTIAWNFGDGTPVQSGVGLTSVTHQYTATGSDTVTVTATDENNLQASASAMITISDPAPAVSLGPTQSIALNQSILLTPILTPENPSWTYTYSWTVTRAGQFISSASSATLTESFATVGVYTVSVVVTDPHGVGGTGSVTINVVDKPPAVTNVLIAPAHPVAGQPLTLTYSYTDPAGLPENGTTIIWYLNGQGDAAFNGQMTIPAASVQRNQSWYAVVTPSDGIVSGTGVNSNTVVVGDPPPQALGVTITPAQPKHANSLLLTYSYSGFYPEAGTTIAWQRNGVTQQALANQKVVPAPLTRGDTWIATVTPSDGTATGAPAAATVVVQPTAPILNALPAVTMTATGLTTPVSWTVSGTDVDSDPITFDCSVPGKDLGAGPAYTFAFPIGTTVVTCAATANMLTSTGTFNVTIENAPPQLSVTPSETVNPGLVTLTATAQDPLNRPLTYAWTQLRGPPIAQPGAQSAATFSFTTFTAGSYVLECTVSDGVGQATSQTTVTVAQLPPVVNLGEPTRTMVAGETLALDASHSVDPNGGTLAYRWSIVSGTGVLSSLSDPVTELTAVTGGQTMVSLTVDDGVLKATGTLLIDVWGLTAPAAPIASAGLDQTVSPGSTVTLDGSGSFDPNGQTLTYAWTWQSGPAVILSNPDSQRATFVAHGAGTDVFLLTVADGSRVSEAMVTVTVVESGAMPTAVVSPTDLSVQLGGAVVLDGSGSSSPSGAPLTRQWTWVGGPYVDLTDATQAHCSGIAYGAGDAVLQLVVSDGTLSSAAAFAHVHVIAGEMTAPIASATGPASAVADSPVVLDGSGSSDPNGLPLEYQWTQLSGPSVTLHTSNGPRAMFVPSQAGTYVFQLNLSDWTFTSSAMVTVPVGAGDVLTAVAAGPPSGFAGDLVTLNGSASHDPLGLPLSFSWSQLSGPPVKLSGTATATPSFEPSADGAYEFQLLVSNGVETSAPASVTVSVVKGGCTQTSAGWLAVLVVLTWGRGRRRRRAGCVAGP